MELSLQPKQTEAFLSKATELLYGGQAGAGKSHLLRAAAIAWCTNIPGLQVYLFRRTSPDLMSNHMTGPAGFPNMLADWVDNKHVTINYSTNTIKFNFNGSAIHLRHCQHEKDKFSYQGAEIHVLLLDEVTHFTESIYRYLRGRVRLGGLKVPEDYYYTDKDGNRQCMFPRVLGGTNPGGIGHQWVKRTFIDFSAPNVITRTPKEEGGFLRQFLPAKLEDNQVLIQNDPDYLDRLHGLGSEALVQAMAEGIWDIAEGGYFEDVWKRADHVVEPFKIPSSWRIDRSFDWGSSKPYSVGFWAESDGTEATMADGTKRIFPRGSLFRIAEIYGWNGKDDEGCGDLDYQIAEKIVDFQASVPWGKRVRPGPADTAIYTRENGPSIADGMAAVPYNIKWTKADKRPGSRATGWQQMRKLLRSASAKPMEYPGLFIFSNCVHFIRTVPILPRDPNKPEDIYTHAEDHVGDESRYRCNNKTKILTQVQVTGN